MGFLGVVNAYLMRVVLSVAITEMVAIPTGNHSEVVIETTCPGQSLEVDFNPYAVSTSPMLTLHWVVVKFSELRILVRLERTNTGACPEFILLGLHSNPYSGRHVSWKMGRKTRTRCWNPVNRHFYFSHPMGRESRKLARFNFASRVSRVRRSKFFVFWKTKWWRKF